MLAQASNDMRIDWKKVLVVVSKHWKDTIGSLFALVLAWLVMFNKVSYEVAGAVLLILWVGRFVNRKIDPLSAFRKEEKDDNAN
jgi:hypothetical protein